MLDDRYLDHRYEITGLQIDPVVGQACRKGNCSKLGRKPLEVLALLTSAGGETVRREVFIEHVWDGDILVGQRGLTDTIYLLRQLLGGAVIRTIPRRGYKLKARVRWLDGDHRPSFSVGQEIPGREGWQLERRLSQSSATETWLARSAKEARTVFRFCRSEAHRRRLQHETTVLRLLREKLAGQTGVFPILDWRLDEPPYYLETGYASLGSLATWAEAQGGAHQIPARWRLSLLTQAAAALEAVHAAGVVHGQLSPDAILIDDVDGEPVAKLGEFGRSKLVDPSVLSTLGITAAGLTQVRAEPGDPATGAVPDHRPEDLYAFGVLLYQLIIGDLGRQPPREGGTSAATPELRQLIEACLAPAPERRISARTLRERLKSLDLEAVTAELSSEAAAVGASEDDSISGAKTASKAGSEAPASESPAPVAPASGPLGSRVALGDLVGPYRLLDVLGEGGMGTVYLAEQRTPVERRVALKLIRVGMDSDQVLARFEAERQALALMGHANVAAVYDASCTAAGHPYFAMEYVKGHRITDHCDRSKLGLRTRVELFLQVCDGVQHAHQKGVIHRDLKPGNLLVKKLPGQAARVKIIDFGVAKSLQRKLTDHTVHTRLGTYVGTPSYSSPEQISGHQVDVDTRADVYSLGVVLYELMAGVTPYSSEELAKKSPLELAQHLDTMDPPTPLARFTRLSEEEEATIATNRSASVDRLREHLGKDVAWIINKCLERDPDDRYPSVFELRKDLERWLDDRPVEARPTTRRYRIEKFIKRHRSAVALATAAVLVLLTTAGLAVVGWVRAEREASRAERAAREAELAADFQVNQLRALDPASMALGLRSELGRMLRHQMTDAGDAPQAVTEADTQLDGLLDRINLVDLTLSLLDGHFFEPALRVVEDEYGEHPELQARLYQSIADTLVELGHYQQALAPQERALEARRSVLGPDHPLTLHSTMRRGVLHHRLGELELARSTLAPLVQVLQERFGDRDTRTLETREHLAKTLAALQETDLARKHYENVLVIRRELSGLDHERTLSTLSSLAQLEFWTGEADRAGPYFEEAIAGYRRVFGADHPKTLAVVAEATAVTAKEGRLDEALAVMEQAVDGLRAALGNHHPETTATAHKLAVHLSQKRDYEKAERTMRDVLKSQMMVVGVHHIGTQRTKANLGFLMSITGQIVEAKALLKESTDAFLRIVGPTHNLTQYYLLHLARVQVETGEIDAAERDFRRLLSYHQMEENAEERDDLLIHNEIGRLLQRRGQLDAAKALHHETLEAAKELYAEDHPRRVRMRCDFGEVLRKQGNLLEAEPIFREALEIQRKNPGPGSFATQQTMARLSWLLAERGQASEALALSAEMVREKVARSHPNDHRLALIRQYHGKTLQILGRTREAEAVLLTAREALEAAGVRVD